MKKMLTVDDNEFNQEILKLIFENSYEVLQVESGEAALEVLPEFRPDIVLLDIMMDGIDGFETCKRIRSDPDNASIVVVMVTACALDAERKRGFDVGANDYIIKPFSNDEITQAVDNTLKSGRL